MKNVFLALVFCFVGSVAFAGECGSCKPVRSTVQATVGVAEKVVTAPVRVVRGVRSRVAVRRAAHRCLPAAVTSACGSCSG